jgi:type II secretory pathway pseudopilin PulG
VTFAQIEVMDMSSKMELERKNKEDGFTLIEVLITIMFLATALIALLSSFTFSFSTLSKMKQMSIATQCIQKELEEIRNMAFEDILNLGISFTNTTFSNLKNSNGILTIEDSVGDDIKKLTVSVVWTYKGRVLRRGIWPLT